MPHRFFVPPQPFVQTVQFTREQVHQLQDVLRLRSGDRVIALDNKGIEYEVELVMRRGDVHGRILEQRPAAGEPHTRIILYQALLKANKFEWVLQKGTEVGIAAFAPVVTARSIADTVGKTKWTRWEQILREAAEQAGRGKIPALNPLMEFEQALAGVSTAGSVALIPWEEEHSTSLASVLQSGQSDTYHLFIGPEGGFAPEEISLAVANGARPVTLGPRILRAETAGLVAATAILYARGEMTKS